MAEVLGKKLVVGLTRRADWEAKLNALLDGILKSIKLKLDGKEEERLAALRRAAANLVYAGALRSVAFEFAGEACELSIVYYPEDGEEDDLDLSVLGLVDLKAEALRVKVKVGDAAYASSVAGAGVEAFSSERLSVEVEGEGNGAKDEGKGEEDQAEGGGKDDSQTK